MGPDFDSLLASFRGLQKSISIYWNAYGGLKAMLRSPYFYAALIITFESKAYWSVDSDPIWYNLTLSVIPNLIGFTLGGYAILLGFADEKFRKFIILNNNNISSSQFMVVNSTFVHFILMQCLSLIIAVVGQGWNYKSGCLALLGFFIFIYAILTSIAATFALLRLANAYSIFVKMSNSLSKKQRRIASKQYRRIKRLNVRK